MCYISEVGRVIVGTRCWPWKAEDYSIVACLWSGLKTCVRAGSGESSSVRCWAGESNGTGAKLAGCQRHLCHWPTVRGMFCFCFSQRSDISQVLHCFMAFGALTLLLWHQRERLVCKNWVTRCWHGYLFGARCRFLNMVCPTVRCHYHAKIRLFLAY